jgi:hypothetical protein
MFKQAMMAIAIGCVGLGGARVAEAQSYEYQPAEVHWHIAGGYSAPTGQISNYLQGGYMLNGGFTISPLGSPLGVRGDFRFSSHDATNNFLSYGTQVTGVQVDSGTGQFSSFSLGPQLTLPLAGRAALYGFAQVGVYRSSLQLTQTAQFSGTYCDPYFGYCDVGVFPGDVLVYDDTRTKFGWDVGVGFQFPRWFGHSYFLEASYHRLEGGQPIEYVPIVLGIRF